MNGQRRRSIDRGFALLELAAVAVVVALTFALLLVGRSDTRRQARLGECLGNLKAHGNATASYAADHADRIWTFSWRKGDMLSQYPDLNGATSDLHAAANQAVDIMRRRSGRDGLQVPAAWFPHLLYSQLVLADYLDEALPQQYVACPEDKDRVCWQENEMDFCDVCPVTPPDCPFSTAYRWAYSTTYELPPSFYSPDSRVGTVQTISQGTAHNFFHVPPSAPLGQRMLHEVRYPSQKVMIYEQTARHFRPRTPFFAAEEARPAMLLVDGSVGVRVTSDSNPGGNPSNPKSPSPTIVVGPDGTPHVGHFRWTRGGLLGRDYGGAEVAY